MVVAEQAVPEEAAEDRPGGTMEDILTFRMINEPVRAIRGIGTKEFAKSTPITMTPRAAVVAEFKTRPESVVATTRELTGPILTIFGTKEALQPALLQLRRQLQHQRPSQSSDSPLPTMRPKSRRFHRSGLTWVLLHRGLHRPRLFSQPFRNSLKISFH